MRLIGIIFSLFILIGFSVYHRFQNPEMTETQLLKEQIWLIVPIFILIFGLSREIEKREKP